MSGSACFETAGDAGLLSMTEVVGGITPQAVACPRPQLANDIPTAPDQGFLRSAKKATKPARRSRISSTQSAPGPRALGLPAASIAVWFPRRGAPGLSFGCRRRESRRP